MSKKSNRFIPLGKSYPLEVRLAAVRDYLSGKGSKSEIALRYNIGYARTIDNWVRLFGPKELSLVKNISVVNKSKSSTKAPCRCSADVSSDVDLSLSREVRLLRSQLKALEKEKQTLQIKVTALDTMIDIAESQLDIQIRKKSGAKQ